MNITKTYDTIIAGAGPAGAAAAYVLAVNGYRTLLLDKEEFPRQKLCGGCLTHKTIRLLRRVFGVSEEDLYLNGIIDFTSNRYEVRTTRGILVDMPTDYTFYFTRRSAYDTYFLEKAREAGAHVRTGERVTAVHLSEDQAECQCKSGLRATAQYIIAADGVNSTVRSLSPFNDSPGFSRSQWLRSMALCVETRIPRAGALSEYSHPILALGWLNRGYAWIFPNKNHLVAGMGGLQSRVKDLVPCFHRFLGEFGLEPPSPRKLAGFPLPYGNFVKRPVLGRLLLAGDAAGLADPMLGEGIYQAHKSGELAALSVMDALTENIPVDQSYPARLRTDLFPEFVYARLFRRILFHPLSRMLDYRLLALVKNRFNGLAAVIHGDRTYRFFKKKLLE